jgi:hypothetical protein
MAAHTDTPSQMKQLAQLLMECDDASESLPDDIIKILNDESLKTRNRLTDEAGQFLHRIRENQHTQDEVETVIDMFPLSLSCKDKEGRLPVQSAVYDLKSSDIFIPLLAEKGNSLDIGGAGMRGGLLCEVPGAKLNKNMHVTSKEQKIEDPILNGVVVGVAVVAEEGMVHVVGSLLGVVEVVVVLVGLIVGVVVAIRDVVLELH